MSVLSSLLSDNLDDVVFEGRNQAYGAYQLRREYQQNLTSAGGITLGIVALLGLLLTWAMHAPVRPVVALVPIDTVDPIKVVMPQKIIEHPHVASATPAAPRPTAAPHAPVPTIPTQVVKELIPTPPTLTQPPTVEPPIDALVGPAQPGTPGGSDDPGLGSGLKANDAGGTGAEVSPQIFDVVEKMPEFAGGQAALLRYLRQHLRYPAKALAQGAEGRVFLSFVVQTDGSIADVQVLKGVGYGLDEEALRVVRQMPAWTPGQQGHHAVPVRFTLPISFHFE